MAVAIVVALWFVWLTNSADELAAREKEEVALREDYKQYTPEWVAQECGLDAEMVRSVAREIGAARGAFASHVWRNAAVA